MSSPGANRYRGYEKPKVEERFDYAELVRRQIDRCLMSSVDDDDYERTVKALEALIPDELQDEQYKEEYSIAVVIEDDWKYSWAGPIRLGTKKKPLMAKIGYSRKRYPVPYVENEDGEKEIDWNDSNIISPHLVTAEYIDWNIRFKAAFNQFVRMGLAVRRSTRG